MFARWIRLLTPCILMMALSDSGRAAVDRLAARNGEELQQAIDRARPGDTILLTPGLVYSGNFVLPATNGAGFITIRTTETAGQPAAGSRVRPSHSPVLARLQSPNRQPAIRTAPGAQRWRLQLLEFGSTIDGGGDIILLGDGTADQRRLSDVPQQLVIDRCYIHGDPVLGQKRGIALNSGATTIVNSHISDIKSRGQDSQAIAGWNGPGPYTIENNYLEASGENFMLGGADAAIPGLVPSDVTFRRNHLSKPVVWREQGWLVKNLFELKNARRVLVEANLMEYSWISGQLGYAILLTPRNQEGKNPWAVIEDVTIRRNLIRHTGGGFQVIGPDANNPSDTTRRVQVVDNLFYDIDAEKWGGTGAFMLIGNGPQDITFEHNTVHHTGNIIIAFGGTRDAPVGVERFRFRHNLIRHNDLGVRGDDRDTGLDTLRSYFPAADFTSNGIGGGEPARYPSGNIFMDAAAWSREFVNPSGWDFRLRPGSRFRGAAGGKDLGADLTAIAAAVGLRPPGR
jgi:hypothetical protein